MKVQSINFINPKTNIYNTETQRNLTYITNDTGKDIFVKNNNTIQPVGTAGLNPVSFMGYSVHIVDGGNHAKNMNHFANSIGGDRWDLYNREVEQNPRDNNIKQLESLEWKLKELSFKYSLSYDKYHDYAYVAIPILACVPLQNLEAQMNAVMGTNTKLIPQNILTKKDEILRFLRVLYENPDKYRQYINYMDPMGQGIEKIYGIIYEINRINNKNNNTKVFVPAGHPEFASIKWFTEQRNQKPELYNYIATKNDPDNSIHNIQQEIKHNGWYDFNLLTLSNAEVVNMKDTNGKDDYIYSAYDACINNSGRGVYNFTPVRDENGNIKGYSYHDNKTVDYPYDEFPANDEIKNIAKFVGRPLKDVLADGETTQAFKDAVWDNRSREPFADKLFRVEDIFPQHERDYNKMSLKGDYIDSSLQLFFRKNIDGEVIFPNCDCEGSGRPSVLSMWGSCFAIFNAIKEDIAMKERFNERGYYDAQILNIKHPQEVQRLLRESKNLINERKYNEAEQVLKYAVDLEKVAGLHGFRPLEALGDLYMLKNNLSDAEECYNIALNELSRKVLKDLRRIDITETKRLENESKIYGRKYTIYETYPKLVDCFQLGNKYLELLKAKDDYIYEKHSYNRLGALQKIFKKEPLKPLDAEPYKKYFDIGELAREARRLYNKLAAICKKRNDFNPEYSCNWAAESMGPNNLAEEIFERRAVNNRHLGDYLHEN